MIDRRAGPDRPVPPDISGPVAAAVGGVVAEVGRLGSVLEVWPPELLDAAVLDVSVIGETLGVVAEFGRWNGTAETPASLWRWLSWTMDGAEAVAWIRARAEGD